MAPTNNFHCQSLSRSLYLSRYIGLTGKTEHFLALPWTPSSTTTTTNLVADFLQAKCILWKSAVLRFWGPLWRTYYMQVNVGSPSVVVGHCSVRAPIDQPLWITGVVVVHVSDTLHPVDVNRAAAAHAGHYHHRLLLGTFLAACACSYITSGLAADLIQAVARSWWRHVESSETVSLWRHDDDDGEQWK